MYLKTVKGYAPSKRNGGNAETCVFQFSCTYHLMDWGFIPNKEAFRII